MQEVFFNWAVFALMLGAALIIGAIAMLIARRTPNGMLASFIAILIGAIMIFASLFMGGDLIAIFQTGDAYFTGSLTFFIASVGPLILAYMRVITRLKGYIIAFLYMFIGLGMSFALISVI